MSKKELKPKVGVVYSYTCPEGKTYVGVTTREKQRKHEHKTKTINRNTKFGEALRRIGYENFTYKRHIKINPTLNLEELTRVLGILERRFIEKFNSVEGGYNSTIGGVQEFSMSEETKQKMSKSAIKRMEREKEDEERWNARNENIRDKRIGYKQSEETKKKISEANNHKKKRVFKLSMDEEILDNFESIADAARSIDEKYTATIKTKSNRISECLKGKRVSIYEHKWIYM